MAQVTIKNNSTEPLGGPNLGVGTDQGDSWNTTVANLNAMLTEIYNRTGGTATLSNNLPSPSNNFRNVIDGGDFTINPWQRGTSFSGIAATATYTADRFFVAGSDASVSAKAARAAFSSLAGFTQAFRFGRTQNASSLSAINAGQIMESADSYRFQGQTACLSFYAASEANYSGGNLGVQLTMGTGTDQSAASALAGTWSGQQNPISSTQALTAAMTRYAFSAVVPTSATQLGVIFNYAPSGSAGAADSLLLMGVQLEVGPGPSLFEHRDVEVELALCQRYCFVINEPASGIGVSMASITDTNIFATTVGLPTPMRAAPSVTVTNGSFGVHFKGAYLAVTGLAALTAGHIATAVNLTANAAGNSGLAAMFIGGGGAGVITASAEY